MVLVPKRKGIVAPTKTEQAAIKNYMLTNDSVDSNELVNSSVTTDKLNSGSFSWN